MLNGRYAKFDCSDEKKFDWELDNLWLVEANLDYVRYKNRPENCDVLVLIRTFQGSGEIILKDNQRFVLTANTLLLVEFREIAKYFCSKEIWDFAWIEFTTMSNLPIVKNCLLSVGLIASEKLLFEQIFEHLTSPSKNANLLGNYQALSWLFQILEKNELEEHKDLAVLLAIKIMNTHLDQPLTMDSLAKNVNLSLRNFQRRFKFEMGESPKHYYDKIRMQYVYAILRKQHHTIEELSYKLGFSSPYHLSSNFKKHFGYSPSLIYKNEV